jgi:hypothetical protein
VRVPTFRSRATLERAALPIQMRIPSDTQMNDAAIAAAKALVKPDQLDACLEILGNFGALLESPDRLKDNPDAAKALTEEARNLHQQLTPYSPALSEMLSDRVAALAMVRYLTARHFIAGWDNVTVSGQPLLYKSGADGLVAEEAMQLLPPQDINEIAVYAQRLMAPDEAVTKN